MSKIIWKNYLIQRYNFYNNTNPRNRSDSDFPFGKNFYATNKKYYFLEKLRNQLKKIPLLVSTYRSLKGYSQNSIDSRINWVETNIQQLYDVRCMLDDELSQLLFDETILLRLLTFSKFYLPKPHFDEMISVLKKEPFLNPDFPHDYLGEQLYIYNSTIKDIPKLPSLKFIGTKYTISLMNSYRQYLITRNSLTFSPKPGDIVIDCGACIGEISTIFAGYVGEKGEVHLFDPIPLHAKFCKLQASLNPILTDVFHINTLAVGEKTFKVNRGTKIDNNKIRPGKIRIDQFKTTSLDNYVSSNSITKVDFIKMDIEGAETDAIIGAKKILKKYKPKLAISIYHKPDDFWSIPLLIKDINTDYKFMFAHHSPIEWESVIYAY